MSLFGRRQVVGRSHRRVRRLELPLSDKGYSLKKIALASLAGASKASQLENQFSGALTERLSADFLALLLRGLNDRVENCLRRIEGGLGPLGEHQTHFCSRRRLASRHKNLDRSATCMLFANDLPILPADPLRYCQLITGRCCHVTSRCGGARCRPDSYRETGHKGEGEQKFGSEQLLVAEVESWPEKSL